MWAISLGKIWVCNSWAITYEKAEQGPLHSTTKTYFDILRIEPSTE